MMISKDKEIDRLRQVAVQGGVKPSPRGKPPMAPQHQRSSTEVGPNGMVNVPLDMPEEEAKTPTNSEQDQQ